MNGIRCICGAKLAEMLDGKAIVLCRKCKRFILLAGSSSVQVLDMSKAPAVT